MCGIGGIRKMGEKPIQEWQVSTLLASLEYRGLDASGVAFQQADGQVAIYKDHEPAWKFIKTKEYRRFVGEQLRADTTTALVHTRKATKGSPFTNKNNHPLFKDNAAVVHNGTITNDDALFRELKLDRSCETDSDIIRAIVDEVGIRRKVIDKLSRMCGTVAAAAVSPKFPGKLLLLRCGNPLVLAHSPFFDHLLFASDKRSLFRVAKPFVNRWNFLMQIHAEDLAFMNLYEESGYIIGEKGMEFHDKFALQGAMGRGYLSYRVYDGDYAVRRERHQEEAARINAPAIEKFIPQPRPQLPAAPAPKLEGAADFLNPKYVYCPNPKCVTEKNEPHLLVLTDEYRNKPLHRLRCKFCQICLAEARVVKVLAAQPN